MTKCSPIKQSVKQQFLPIGQVSVDLIEQGYLYSSNYSGLVIVIAGQIFKFRDALTIIDLANAFLGIETTEPIERKVNKALVDIFKVTDYNQSIPFNDPIRIFA